MDNRESENGQRIEATYRLQLQQLENILREMGARGEVGEDPAWIQEYVYRLLEVSEALRGIAMSKAENNPSHKSYR